MAKFPPRICAYCGKEFIPLSNHAIYCKGPHFMTCPVCGKEYEVKNNDKLKFPPTACSYACRTVRRTETSLQKYGCVAPGNNSEARKKARESMVKRFGVEYTLQSDELKDRCKKTNLERYGCENPGSNRDVIAKRRETNIKRYGIYPFNTPECYARSRQTMIDRYGEGNPFRIEEFRKKGEQTCIERYGVPHYGGSRGAISAINKEFQSHLTDMGIDVVMEFSLGGKFFDIAIPSMRILIEIDPTYTHNVIGNHWGDGIDPRYHLEKSLIAKEHGYRCIHVWDWDDWGSIFSLLEPREKVYARKCKLFKLYKDTTDEFLDCYHIQGSCRGQKLSLGLLYNDELIEVMTFGTPRYSSKHSVELLRLCTKPGYQVIGGASRLFKFAVDTFEMDNIISYCDLSKFTGDVYESIGMEFLRRTDPQEIWSKEDKKITANLLRQRGYDQLFGTTYGKGTSNEQLMLDNGWLPVYDCGQAVFEYRR